MLSILVERCDDANKLRELFDLGFMTVLAYGGKYYLGIDSVKNIPWDPNETTFQCRSNKKMDK